jgi:hypothetical protein
MKAGRAGRLFDLPALPAVPTSGPFPGALKAPIRYTTPVPALHIIFASTSGHTEFVVDMLIEELKIEAPEWSTEKQRAEDAKPEDLQKGDVLLLASASWNTGGIEGQLNPYMFMVYVAQGPRKKCGFA